MNKDVAARIGRPLRVLTHQEREKLAAMAARGQRRVDAAAALNMSADTLRRILKEDDEAARAWDFGRAQLHQTLAGMLIDRALDGELTAIIFAMKAFFNYRDVGQPSNDEQRAPLVNISLMAPLTPEQYREQLPALKQSITVTAKSGGEDEG